jgi:hypothetical protein
VRRSDRSCAVKKARDVFRLPGEELALEVALNGARHTVCARHFCFLYIPGIVRRFVILRTDVENLSSPFISTRGPY